MRHQPDLPPLSEPIKPIIPERQLSETPMSAKGTMPKVMNDRWTALHWITI